MDYWIKLDDLKEGFFLNQGSDNKRKKRSQHVVHLRQRWKEDPGGKGDVWWGWGGCIG